MAISRLTIIKLTELILAIACFLLHYHTFEGDSNFTLFLITTTLGGYAIIVIGVFIGYITGNHINKNVDLFFCIAGAVLYVVSGIFSFQRFHGWKFDESRANLGLAKAVLAIVQGIVFIVDAFFTFKAE